ncbi:hypothetical protein V1478_007435 [Vespula squamosa]|uniref:Uncharacterized protein n=1 Tax=Vespula squamosa TaxID=30214 RepID=A0ABD2B353_VESSQ
MHQEPTFRHELDKLSNVTTENQQTFRSNNNQQLMIMRLLAQAADIVDEPEIRAFNPNRISLRSLAKIPRYRYEY